MQKHHSFTKNNPLALYIHIPWCVRKCPYCDFNSHQNREDSLPEAVYVQSLIDDLEQDLAWMQQNSTHEHPSISSIFFGGGTPSLFSPDAIHNILTAVQHRLPYKNPEIEITLEANPGTVERGKFEAFRSAGINRLSIGIQSFQDEKLKALGRIHDSQSAIRAAETAHHAGFNSFNLDLMHGLPNQTLSDALYDIKTALALSPPHLSWYQLTLEPNTVFYRQPPPLPPEDTLAEIQEHGQDLLARAGLIQYEVSAYSKQNHQCQHNVNYWEFGDYLGIGAGAHGKLHHTRTWKKKQPNSYMENPLGGLAIIPEKELPFEFMLNALRLYKPSPFSLFEARTGLSRDVLTEKLRIAETKKLIHKNTDYIEVTPLGRRFLNDLVGLFV